MSLLPSKTDFASWLGQGFAWGVVLLGLSANAAAQPPVHYLHQGTLPTGEIGTRQLDLGGGRRGYFQPVQVTAPEGSKVSLATAGGFVPGNENGLLAGMLIGQVYRIKVTGIPGDDQAEVFPTIEVVDRLHPPPGQAARFPIPIELTEEELKLAAQGNYVQRVIYLENPRDAVPVKDTPPSQRYYEVAANQDVMQTADQLGRPMAILRMGSRVPGENGPDEQFLYSSPPALAIEKGPQVQRDNGLEKPVDAPPIQGRAAKRFPRLPETQLMR